jgi:hypothetical protein
MTAIRYQIADWRTLIACALLACCSAALASSGGPPDGKTGRPGEGTCADCHSGGIGAADSTELVGIPGSVYVPGSVYGLTLTVRQTGASRWGFELTVVDQTGTRAGQLMVTDPTNTQYSNSGPGYLKQTSAGTFRGNPGPVSWSFAWRAPSAGSGPVRFYWTYNAANNNGGTSGDILGQDSLLVTESSGIGADAKQRGRIFLRYRNPAKDRVVLDYQGIADRPVRIYSTEGRLVRRLSPVPVGEVLRVVWDGRDESGRPVPEAGYMIRLGREVTSAVRVEVVR